MTRMDAAVRQVRAMATGVIQARSKTVAALQQTHEVRTQSASAGFAAVAAGLALVSDGLVGAQARLTAAGETIDEASSALAHAVDQESVVRLITTLAPVPAALRRARADLMATSAAIGEARHRVVTVLQGGQPGPLLAALDTVNEILHLVRQHADTAQAHLASAATEAQQLGVADSIRDGDEPVSGPQSALVADREPGVPGRDDPIPGWIQDAAVRLPHRRNGKGPTHGLLTDLRGAALADPPLADGAMLRSGTMPGARDGLRTDWYPLAQVTTEHVEAHAAALLRRPRSPRHAVLLINNPTCTSRGQYVGCDELLPGMLPNNTTLTVYVTDGQTTTMDTTYTGTGEGIAP